MAHTWSSEASSFPCGKSLAYGDSCARARTRARLSQRHGARSGEGATARDLLRAERLDLFAPRVRAERVDDEARVGERAEPGGVEDGDVGDGIGEVADRDERLKDLALERRAHLLDGLLELGDFGDGSVRLKVREELPHGIQEVRRLAVFLLAGGDLSRSGGARAVSGERHATRADARANAP